jgi:hypothetical protein
VSAESPPPNAPPDRFARDVSGSVHELLTWRDVADATDALIDSANKTIDLFDHNLQLKGWQQLERYTRLRNAIVQRGVQVRLMLCDTQSLRSECPRIVSLLSTHAHCLSIFGTRNQNNLSSSFAVADRQHLIFRPNMVQSRGAFEFDNPSKSMIWVNQFEVTWQQGGRKMFADAFGL